MAYFLVDFQSQRKDEQMHEVDHNVVVGYELKCHPVDGLLEALNVGLSASAFLNAQTV